MPSIFAKIIRKEIPAHIVYEDDLVIAFLDISQATKGHTLVVTKDYYQNIWDLPQDVASYVFSIVHKLSLAILKAFEPAGINILNNNGIAAGQTVFHYHVHLIPRYLNDDLDIKLPNNSDKTTSDDYKKRANLIKSALL